MEHNKVLVTSKMPKLDLHNEIVAMVEVLVNTFINDNKLLKNEYIIIIHGKSTNILTEEVHRILKNNKDVADFYKDNWNLGQTIVQINL